MAAGDILVFDEAKLAMLNGTHDFDTDTFYCAILLDTSTMSVSEPSPTLGDVNFVEHPTAGTYTAGGKILENNPGLGVTEVGGTVTVDSNVNPTWAQDAGNSTNARWGLIYNSSKTNQAVAYVDLGGAVNMQNGALTITWSATGIFTLA